jgi:hypothetical protein
MSLEQEIKASIEKNLPKQVGDALRERLEQADKTEEALRVSERQLKAEKEISARFGKEIDALKALKNDARELNELRLSLENQTRDLAVKTLEIQLEAEKSKSTFGFSVALGLVRNTDFRRNLTDSKTLPGTPNAQGYINPPQTTFQNSTETNSAD